MKKINFFTHLFSNKFRFLLILLALTISSLVIFLLLITFHNDRKIIDAKHYFLNNQTLLLNVNNLSDSNITNVINTPINGADYHLVYREIPISIENYNHSFSMEPVVNNLNNSTHLDPSKSLELFDASIKYGRDFTKDEINGLGNPVIIMESLSLILFGTSNSVNNNIYIKLDGREMVLCVIGVLDDSINTREKYIEYKKGITTKLNYRFYVPARSVDSTISLSMNYLIYSTDNVNQLKSHLENILLNKTYEILTWSDYEGEYNGVKNNLVAKFFGVSFPIIVASIIFLVIISIYSQKERKIEYSIKRAIGAKKSDILMMVFQESLFLGGLGILLGLCLGLLIFILPLFKNLQYQLSIIYLVNWWSYLMIVSLIFSLFVIVQLSTTFIKLKINISDGLKYL
jgi:ABC-type antimicrobial peptide transport system permease subunit